jgi:cbb3-type cytochrome oxidase maturation protein
LTILYLLIPLGLLLLGLAIAAFFWATKSGQFDDLDSPAWSVVMDDDRAPGNFPSQAEDEASDGKDGPTEPES